MWQKNLSRWGAGGAAVLCVSITLVAGPPAGEGHVSRPFAGVKVKGGTVTHAVENGKDVLRLSGDFKIPEAPDPHWQIVDSAGTSYLLERLEIKDGRKNLAITVPGYIADIDKVRIWCAFAETVLGETSFGGPMKLGVTDESMTAMHRTSRFKGAKANAGFATHSRADGQSTLTLSDDFVVPDAPAPHWQVVDSRGRRYLLNRLMIKGDKPGMDRLNRTITVPSYVPDIAEVEIWCAWAETLLGEAPFEKPVR